MGMWRPRKLWVIALPSELVQSPFHPIEACLAKVDDIRAYLLSRAPDIVIEIGGVAWIVATPATATLSTALPSPSIYMAAGAVLLGVSWGLCTD